uniref:U2A'/phosphoprotein 32 family A C-terminal domain-containing protein n=1 Tax=Arcella intermedia TaxID=1963864 RepID=A0A6B2L9L1_9EUKA
MKPLKSAKLALLESLDLSNNKIKLFKEVHKLVHLPSITVLSLEGNPVTKCPAYSSTLSSLLPKLSLLDGYPPQQDKDKFKLGDLMDDDEDYAGYYQLESFPMNMIPKKMKGITAPPPRDKKIYQIPWNAPVLMTTHIKDFCNSEITTSKNTTTIKSQLTTEEKLPENHSKDHSDVNPISLSLPLSLPQPSPSLDLTVPLSHSSSYSDQNIKSLGTNYDERDEEESTEEKLSDSEMVHGPSLPATKPTTSLLPKLEDDSDDTFVPSKK